MRASELDSILASSSDPQVNEASAALRALFGDSYLGDFAVAFWDGSYFGAKRSQQFVLCVNTPGALRAAFTPPLDLGFGRAFARGELDVKGSLEYAVDCFLRAGKAMTLSRAVRLATILRRLPKSPATELHEADLHGGRHSRRRDLAAVGFHYDQPLAFYRSFLDQQLQYSAAYFDEGAETLDAAQAAKLDYTLRKLHLRSDERLLDIGCGWGALVVRAAQQFGARALGITLSRVQCEEAQRHIERAGVGNRVRVELRDYRDLGNERFDKIASIGMFEHVGRAQLRRYFRKVFSLLRPGGLFLNSGISNQNEGRKGGRTTGFIARFVFPDGELVPIGDALAIAERAGFEVRDVESLREHYAQTLRLWVANLERHRHEAVAASGLENYRTWRLYMAGSAQGFVTGRLGVFQSLLARPGDDGSVALPPTRRNLYR